jgi:hypothetical protein
MSVAKCNAWLDQRCEGMPTLAQHILFYILFTVNLLAVSLKGGCTLSNNPIVGVHNIPESTLLKELEARQIPIPLTPRSQALPAQVVGVKQIEPLFVLVRRMLSNLRLNTRRT